MLCECEGSLEAELGQPHVSAVAGKEEYQYMTIRPDEDSSLIVACRITHCEHLEVKCWHKRANGTYTTKRK